MILDISRDFDFKFLQDLAALCSKFWHLVGCPLTNCRSGGDEIPFHVYIKGNFMPSTCV